MDYDVLISEQLVRVNGVVERAVEQFVMEVNAKGSSEREEIFAVASGSQW